VALFPMARTTQRKKKIRYEDGWRRGKKEEVTKRGWKKEKESANVEKNLILASQKKRGKLSLISLRKKRRQALKSPLRCQGKKGEGTLAFIREGKRETKKGFVGLLCRRKGKEEKGGRSQSR